MPVRNDLPKTLPWIAKLQETLSCEVLCGEPLSRHTSIGVGGIADVMIFPRNVKDLGLLVSFLSKEGITYLPVGNWTNLIVKDGGIRDVVISLKGLKGLDIKEGRDDKASFRAEAGIHLAELVQVSSKKGYAGMEFCAGIPGTVGGAVKMNAGAFGKEIKDVVETVFLLDQSGAVTEVKRNALHFEYRNLALPEGSIVVSAEFILEKGMPQKIKDRIAEIMEQRRQRHPLEYRNAGSIFKNPRNIPAGRIIEELGLKGTRVGDAQISEKHGNFIVNLGNAKAVDIVALIELVQKKVLQERSVRLDTEVKIVGE